MAFCTQCGTQLVQNARFCTSCGASVEATLVGPVALSPGDPGRYGGLFGKHRRDQDFRTLVEQTLASDILSWCRSNSC